LRGCETCSVILREERRLRVFENWVLRIIVGPRREGVTGEWRKLHNEEINDQYCSHRIVKVIKSRRMRWAEHVARMRKEKCIKGLGGKSWGKKFFGSPSRRWEDNIKADVQGWEWGGM